jgi:hypothetical protein
MFAMMSLSFPKTVRSQTSVLTAQFIDDNDDDDDDDNDGQDSNSSQTSSGNGLNLFLILNLINALNRSSNNDQEQVDFSIDIAEIRGQVGRMYFLLARQYLDFGQD